MEAEMARFLHGLRNRWRILNEVQVINDSYNLNVDVGYELQLNVLLKLLYEKVSDMCRLEEAVERDLHGLLLEVRKRLTP